MSEEKPELSYEELISILRKSATLQNSRETREFTKTDLVAAAAEVGIDREIVNQVVEAHLARRESSIAAPRPVGSKIIVHATPERFELTVPPVRPAGTHAVALGFLGFWFATLAFVGHRAVGMGRVFTIPLWLVGAAMSWWTVRPIMQRVRLTLEPGRGTLEISPFGSRRSFATADLAVRIVETIVTDGQHRSTRRSLALEYGTETSALVAGYSDQEVRWVESELRNWLTSAS